MHSRIYSQPFCILVFTFASRVQEPKTNRIANRQFCWQGLDFASTVFSYLHHKENELISNTKFSSEADMYKCRLDIWYRFKLRAGKFFYSLFLKSFQTTITESVSLYFPAPWLLIATMRKYHSPSVSKSMSVEYVVIA